MGIACMMMMMSACETSLPVHVVIMSFAHTLTFILLNYVIDNDYPMWLRSEKVETIRPVPVNCAVAFVAPNHQSRQLTRREESS